MLLLIIRVVFACVCIGAIATYVNIEEVKPAIVKNNRFLAFVVMLLITQTATFADFFVKKKRIEIISAIYFGLMIGYLLTHLFMLAIQNNLQESYREPVQMLAALILPYLCVTLILQTKDDFRFLIPYVEFSRELKGGKPLILDSSALIDGRIADVVDTKILDAQLVVPQFILHEIQDIADSNDKMRRTRGRRGLDVLSKLQNSPNADIRMHDTPDRGGDSLSVDQRLVLLAKELGGRVVTNDFNLNKVASVQGVDVINLNDVANSLKPRYLPGERVQIKVMKEGESPGQGVGYLDDGTMVVCEQAQHLIGKEIDVIVTSMLQSSAGRMIF
ncbi:MAG: TRAM domain-containing protein, partial [Planctomycetaceae bacterium]|nr:TRAM domain-containing protein [Planctomycetaceae bacterium]